MTSCAHPEDRRTDSLGNFGDPAWAYCLGCAHVLHIEDGVWVAQPTGITKATYR